MTALIAVGSAVLRAVGLNPQSITEASEARVPGKATFFGMDYQLTGLGERAVSLEVETWPLVVGGLDALGWLVSHHQAQDVVPVIRLGANYLGRVEGAVTIRSYEIEEGRIHPFTGVGRRVGATIELLHVGDF